MKTRRRFLLIALTVIFGSALLERPWSAAMTLRPAQSDEAARDAWQRPDAVMDALGIAPGSVVADVGCGEGYFVARLSRRVAAEGAVYAEDLEDEALDKIRARIQEEKLSNVRLIQGTAVDPRLPANTLDAVLVVNAYHEFIEYDAMLQALLKALKPGGRLGIIDAAGDQRRTRAKHQAEHTITEKLVREDAARNGFVFHSREKGFDRPDGRRHEYFFLIFERPAT